MYYFDNAATSFPKPRQVTEACVKAMETAGNSGRGSHARALTALEILYEARQSACRLIHGEDALSIYFTQNATMALNEAIAQIEGEIVTTAMEHNSVLRPCYARGNTVYVQAPGGVLTADAVIEAINENTRAVVMCHASNLTGEIFDIAAVGRVCRQRGILFIVDAAQTAGCVPIDVQEMHIDMLAFSGHKGTLGPTGTGVLYVRPGCCKLHPFLRGGTGSKSYDLIHPQTGPDTLEAGTQNIHGIAGLKAGIDYVMAAGIENIHAHDMALAQLFIREVLKIDGAEIYRADCQRTGTVAVNFGDIASDELCAALGEEGVCVRGGAHCAPLAHKALGTENRGAVRFSFGWFNTEEEVMAGVGILRDLLA